MQIERIGVGQRMSKAVCTDGMVFTCGEVATDKTKDAFGQTQEILDALDASLRQAGTHKERILSATVWLADIKDFAEMNRAWDAWVPQGHTPARATVEARLVSATAKVEIAIIALR
ncbi:MAG: RidA family protein [Rhizobiales bacterium]|nr:RidA family protein [Hyphomicrobiales bacterium]